MPDKKNLKFNYLFSKYGILFVLLAIIVVAAVNSPEFLSVNNMLNILRQVMVIGMMAIGMTFVLITGGVDLSVGSMLTLGGVVSVTLMASLPIPVAILIGLAAGTLCGLLNGVLITSVGSTMGGAFIITFGTQTVIASLALMVTNGDYLQAGIYKGFEVLGQGSLGIIPISVLIFAAFFVVAHLLLSRTGLGRITYSIGLNDEVVRLSGIKIRKVRVLAYVISGFMASLAGIVLCSRIKSASPAQGVGYELDVIAAVVLGGTRMGGGYGSMWKTLIGILIFGVLSNALNIMGVSTFPQLMIRGLIIIVSVLMDMRSSKIEKVIQAME